MLSPHELRDVKRRLRWVNDLLIDIRTEIGDDDDVQLALSIRKIEGDIVNLAASIKVDAV